MRDGWYLLSPGQSRYVSPGSPTTSQGKAAMELEGSGHILQRLDKLKQHLKYMDLISSGNEIKPDTMVPL